MQRSGESVEKYAAELKMLYDKAHMYRNRRFGRFLDRLKEEDARFEVEYHKELETIDEVVYHVVNFMQTRDSNRHSKLARSAIEGDDTISRIGSSLAQIEKGKGQMGEDVGRQGEDHAVSSATSVIEHQHVRQKMLETLESIEKASGRNTENKQLRA